MAKSCVFRPASGADGSTVVYAIENDGSLAQVVLGNPVQIVGLPPLPQPTTGRRALTTLMQAPAAGIADTVFAQGDDNTLWMLVVWQNSNTAPVWTQLGSLQAAGTPGGPGKGQGGGGRGGGPPGP